MALDFRNPEIQFLLSQLAKGNVILFAGAGFSVGATNQQGQSPPMATQIAELLCKACGWDYAGDELAIIYDQAEKHLGTHGLRSFLEQHYKGCSPADWHRLIPHICWYRIYTTNIDDVLVNAYATPPGQQRLSIVVCPSPYENPDFFMERVTCVHLHGSVYDLSKRLTFTLDDIAHTTAVPNPWYQALVDDMQARSILFVGTRLNEPPFYHYIATRDFKAPGARDIRAKGFLVSPNISPVRIRQLQDQNIVPIVASGGEFFQGLSEFLRGAFPKRTEVLRALYPHQLRAIERQDVTLPSELLRQFEFIVPDSLPELGARGRSLFYLGAEPTWSDIQQNVDAEREITATIIEDLLDERRESRCLILAGYAGSGKSTILKRVACEVSRRGKTVYFFKGESVLEIGPIQGLQESLAGRTAYIFIDGAVRHFQGLKDLAARLDPESGLVFVLADRSHHVYVRVDSLVRFDPQVRDIPELNRRDTERILAKLKEHGFLGDLQGKRLEVQVHAFLVRAHKQLLVALREATSGKGFDAILAGEFASLSDDQARLAYLIASLAALHGAPGVRRRHLLACLDGTDIEKARILKESLRDVVVPREGMGDILAPRHRVIGHFIAVEIAPLEMKVDAVTRFLIQVSPDITPMTIRSRSPEYIAYRGLINFDGMRELFGPDYEVMAGVYAELQTYYSHDFLFWLQYGRAELEFDHFDAAETFLKQSLGIRPDSHQSQHHLGVLYIKKSYILPDYVEAEEDAKRGEEILRGQIEERGALDPYPYTALLIHKLRFLQRVKVVDRKEQLEALRDLAREARDRHPFDQATLNAVWQVERGYLMQAVPGK